MDSNREEAEQKPHAICVPLPVQSHIKAMLQFSKLLHRKGFHITFVNTDFNHQRFIKSMGAGALDGLPDFRFQTIPDGLPRSDPDATQSFFSLCDSIANNMLPPFSDLLDNLNNPQPTCIVSDPYMTFTMTAAEKLGIPILMLSTISASALMLCNQVSSARDKGLIPLKDESFLTNGYLETTVDWIPGMKDIRLMDFPSFIRTTDPNDFTISINIVMEVMEKATKASGVVIHTFDALEGKVLGALSPLFPNVYAVGPLQLLLNHSPNDDPLKAVGYSLWKEEDECLHWLDSKQPNSVIYVNFGSIAVMTQQQLLEFAWGLANCNFPFLFIVRPDLVNGESAILPPEFLLETKERGVIATWCPQEEVLNHPAVGVFLTHCGWNSMIEGLSAGVPLLCCPFFGDQPTNCRYACNVWRIGMEIENNATRKEVGKIVRELMEGENGKKIKQNVLEWKKLAEEATDLHGSSFRNLEDLVNLLLSKG
ncbi:7-deoxyloganetin glucosyltransferase-like [Corylus avellana]|uniref:7-deoxyloganetin glucosyltransferase-like n=1 Tax=Corylus avellana TaxID=13451 RepID=UPI001E20968B|nr:7-deoxyloganetin glucosyltransferase-like [Corylus avellana]